MKVELDSNALKYILDALVAYPGDHPGFKSAMELYLATKLEMALQEETAVSSAY